MLTVRVYLWCATCGQVAVLRKGDACVRCVGLLEAAHPELWSLDEVARMFDVHLADQAPPPRRSWLARLVDRLARP